MSFLYRRAYNGRLCAVILDWAGTTVDYGCFAPVAVFLDVFAARGVSITLAEARAPMGRYKRDHIAEIGRMPRVAAAWQEAHGRLPDDDDVQVLFEDAAVRQIDAIVRHAELIPGAAEAVTAFRGRGLKIGSCTGYTRAMMEVLLPLAREQGYEPDALVCPDDVPAGRPAPWMCFTNAMRLGVYPMEAMVKIGDTPVDIEEGLNAGMWTIGLARTGNELGLSEAEINALPLAEVNARLESARERLRAAGAHYVVDALSDTPALLDAIDSRLAAGEKP